MATFNAEEWAPSWDDGTLEDFDASAWGGASAQIIALMGCLALCFMGIR